MTSKLSGNLDFSSYAMEEKVKCNRNRVSSHTIVSFVVVMLVLSFLLLTSLVMVLFREYSSLQKRLAFVETKLKTQNSTKLSSVDPRGMSETGARTGEVRSCKLYIDY